MLLYFLPLQATPLFTELPVDLLVQMAQRGLSLRDLQAVCCVCRSLRSLGDERVDGTQTLREWLTANCPKPALSVPEYVPEIPPASAPACGFYTYEEAQGSGFY